MKATIKCPDGTEIHFEGSTDEVGAALRSLVPLSPPVPACVKCGKVVEGVVLHDGERVWCKACVTAHWYRGAAVPRPPNYTAAL